MTGPESSPAPAVPQAGTASWAPVFATAVEPGAGEPTPIFDELAVEYPDLEEALHG